MFNDNVSESRIELELHESHQFLGIYNTNFWQNFLFNFGIKIISSINSHESSAYLLSHSSLFVIGNKIILITCGSVDRNNIIEKLLSNIGASQIQSLSIQERAYIGSIERSMHPQLLQNLNKTILKDFYLESKVRDNSLTANFSRNETGMCNGGVFHLFGLEEEKLQDISVKNVIVNSLIENLPNSLSSFLLDKHSFSPFGFSMNLLSKDAYTALHIYPETSRSYASLEGNVINENNAQEIQVWLVSQLNPKSIFYEPFAYSLDFCNDSDNLATCNRL